MRIRFLMASAMLVLGPLFARSEVSGADASSAPRIASAIPIESGAVTFSELLKLAGQEPVDADTGEPLPKTNKDEDNTDNSEVTTGGEEPRETGEPTNETT